MLPHSTSKRQHHPPTVYLFTLAFNFYYSKLYTRYFILGRVADLRKAKIPCPVNLKLLVNKESLFSKSTSQIMQVFFFPDNPNLGWIIGELWMRGTRTDCLLYASEDRTFCVHLMQGVISTLSHRFGSRDRLLIGQQQSQNLNPEQSAPKPIMCVCFLNICA